MYFKIMIALTKTHNKVDAVPYCCCVQDNVFLYNIVAELSVVLVLGDNLSHLKHYFLLLVIKQ